MITINKITIITVCYNAVSSIEATLKNVTELVISRKVKFIVIDGGSTDGTAGIIKKYGEHISYCISEPDKGIYDAMNKGWDKAGIDSHILFLGAGDKILELPDMDLRPDTVYFGDTILGDNETFKAKVDFRLKLGNTVHHQALLIPKELHPQPPFNADYKIYGDFDFNQRLLKRGVTFIKVGLKSYVLPGGVSQHFKTKEWYYIIKKNFGPLHAFLGYLYYRFQVARKKAPGI